MLLKNVDHTYNLGDTGKSFTEQFFLASLLSLASTYILLASVKKKMAHKTLCKAIGIKNFKKRYCLCEQKEFKCWTYFTERRLTYNTYAKLVPPSVSGCFGPRISDRQK